MTGRLVVERVDDKTVRLKEPYIRYSEVMGEFIEVPAGFNSDYASVPRLPLVWFILGNRGHKEAVIHDYLYAHQPVDRKTADKVFLEHLADAGMWWHRRYMMYFGVRLFGWVAWRRHKRRLGW